MQFKWPLRTTVAGAIVLGLMLSGCGTAGSSSSSNATPAANGIRFNGKAATITLTSPTIVNGGSIPAASTCDGKDVSPPLRWGAVPQGTAELSIFAVQLAAGEGGTPKIEWTVAGIDPTLHEISTGAVPSGAIPGKGGKRSTRYSLCPPKNSANRYLFMIFAVSHRMALSPGYSGISLLKALGKVNAPFGAILSSYTRP
jgi:phosphatidylethanolamine-binding protein (PEBP) family uncharacterized protein